MSKVRCAVIGAGWWGTTAHVPAMKEHPDAELVAVHHHDPTSAKKIAKDFEVPLGTSSVEELLAVKDLHAVSIASTPHMHYAHAKAALQRGAHVLIEKPMTLRVAEAEELAALAKQKDRQILMSCPWHFTPHGIEARRLVQSGKLGQIKMISILMTNFTLGLYQGLPWEKVFGRNPTLQNSANPYLKPGQTSYSDPAVAGGGQIYCQVSHAAAYVGFLTGRQPAEAFARFDNSGTVVDIYDALNFKLDDGTLVNLASNGATPLSKRNYEVRIYGTEGMILLELWNGTMEFHDMDCNVKRFPDIPEADVYPMFGPIKNLIDVAAGKSENGSPGSVGIFSMKIIEASCESARSGKNVLIKN
jgi:predicted dehydrogenase